MKPEYLKNFEGDFFKAYVECLRRRFIKCIGYSFHDERLDKMLAYMQIDSLRVERILYYVEMVHYQRGLTHLEMNELSELYEPIFGKE